MLCQFFSVVVFWKASFFGKQGLITHTSFVYKTSRLVRIFLLISALNKRVLPFFSGKLFHKSRQKTFFPVFAYPDISIEGLGEFLAVMQTLDFVSGLHNCLEFSQPLSCLYQARQHGKHFLLLKQHSNVYKNIGINYSYLIYYSIQHCLNKDQLQSQQYLHL